MDSIQDSISFIYEGEFTKPFSGDYLVGGGNGAYNILDIRKIAGSFYQLNSPTGWYPFPPFLDRTIFEMSFRIPEDMQLIAAGRKLGESLAGKKKEIKYATTNSDLIASFSLGFFKQ